LIYKHLSRQTVVAWDDDKPIRPIRSDRRDIDCDDVFGVQDGSGAGFKLCYGKPLSLRGHFENRWLKEGVDFIGEREHGPGHAQNEQKQTRNQSTDEMEVEQD
jgi:hypothetical protein